MTPTAGQKCHRAVDRCHTKPPSTNVTALSLNPSWHGLSCDALFCLEESPAVVDWVFRGADSSFRHRGGRRRRVGEVDGYGNNDGDDGGYNVIDIDQEEDDGAAANRSE